VLGETTLGEAKGSGKHGRSGKRSSEQGRGNGAGGREYEGGEGGTEVDMIWGSMFKGELGCDRWGSYPGQGVKGREETRRSRSGGDGGRSRRKGERGKLRRKEGRVRTEGVESKVGQAGGRWESAGETTGRDFRGEQPCGKLCFWRETILVPGWGGLSAHNRKEEEWG